MWKEITVLSFIIQCSIAFEITPIKGPVAGIGFAPLWSDCTQSLYYVDYTAAGQNLSLFRYDYHEDRVYGAYIAGATFPPSFILPVKDCSKNSSLFVVGNQHDTVVVEWDGKTSVARYVSTLFSVETFDRTSRWCLGNASPQGQFYGGTGFTTFCNAPSNASFYMYSPHRGVTRLFGGLISTTGVAYDRKHLYHVDACTNRITAFDRNSCGDICNGRVVFDFKTLGLGIPDFVALSLTIDTKGFIYTTNYAGNEIWKINPRKSSGVPIVRMPFKGLGGVTFGGPMGDILFVVTVQARVDVLLAQVTDRTAVPTSLYKITGLGAKGRRKSSSIKI